ncbi:MAG: hypothetical protein BWY31_04758 [Lentisphaerae bacterium ADurb.Bin242]|nr:MAG: hypothetical protein BWY31_04758 [Lentisphaerae bacterium ADurb.Bin242]
MAGFRQEHEGRDRFVPPVSAYIGMVLMPISDRLEMLERNHLSQCAGIDDFFDFHGKGGIAQYMADRENHIRFLYGRDNVPASLRRGRHRFFQQDRISPFCKSDRRFLMHRVQRANQYGVCEFRKRRNLLPLPETHVFRQFVRIGDFVTVEIARIGHSDHPRLFRETLRIFGVSAAAAAAAENNDFNRRHSP